MSQQDDVLVRNLDTELLFHEGHHAQDAEGVDHAGAQQVVLLPERNGTAVQNLLLDERRQFLFVVHNRSFPHRRFCGTAGTPYSLVRT